MSFSRQTIQVFKKSVEPQKVHRSNSASTPPKPEEDTRESLTALLFTLREPCRPVGRRGKVTVFCTAQPREDGDDKTKKKVSDESKLNNSNIYTQLSKIPEAELYVIY